MNDGIIGREYTFTALETWTNEQWDEIVSAVEDLICEIADEFEMEEN